MNRKTKILSVALALLVFAAAFSGIAFAEDTFKDNVDCLQGYDAAENKLLLYCSSSVDELRDAERITVTLDENDFPVVEISPTEQEPITYFCLVDVSGSIEQAQLYSVKPCLQAICDGLRDGDKMVIATMGDTVVSSGYLSDTGEITKAINAIKLTNQNTNLYRALVDVLKELNTSADATARKCMVIFSDGVDDSSAEAGRTRQEAERMIVETRIPIYSFVVPYAQKEAGKTLGSIARVSVGGEAYYCGDRSMTEEQIGEAITKDMKSDSVITLDLTGFSPQKDDMLLRFSYQTDEGTFGDTLTVYRSNLRLSAPELEKEEPNLGLEAPEKPERFPLWLMIAIPCVLIAAGLTAWLLIRKKQKDDELKRQREIALMNQTEPTETYLSPDYIPVPIKTLRFTTIGNNSFSSELRLEEGRELTVGRTNRADIVLNGEDKKLSSVHFGICYKGNALTVWDAGSTNGTLVNDVPLKGNRMEIRDGDILGAGSYRYRVQFIDDVPDGAYVPTMYCTT